MIYINVNENNEWVLNINNNVRNFPSESGCNPCVLQYRFTHILSDQLKVGTCELDTTGPLDFFATWNDRYLETYITSDYIKSLTPYDGEYDVEIRNDQTVILYKGIWKVTGNSEAEENPFVEYQSDNENNDSYIYIEE